MMLTYELFLRYSVEYFTISYQKVATIGLPVSRNEEMKSSHHILRCFKDTSTERKVQTHCNNSTIELFSDGIT